MDDFAKMVQDLKPVSLDDFKPHAYYDADGDCIEFVTAPDTFYGKRLDDLVTVYLSNDNNEVMGGLIKGAKRFIRNSPNFMVIIEDNRVRLSRLLIARIGQSARNLGEWEIDAYRQLIHRAEESGVDAELSAFGA